MVIKPFKVAPKVPDNFGMETWDKLKTALDAVYSKSTSLLSKEVLYRAVEDLCGQKMGARTYELLMVELETNITKKVLALDQQSVDWRSYLQLVDSVWCDHTDQLNTIRNIFLYLDRNYALQHSGVKVIWEAGNDVFRRQLENFPQVINRITVGLIAAVEGHRNKETNETDVLSRLCRMLSTLDKYAQFEYVLCQDSKRFFAAEGTHLANTLSPSDFLALVDRRLQECTDMCSKLLDPSSRKPLLEIVETHLFTPHLPQLVEKGFKSLLDGDRVEDLRRMYLLFGRVKAQNMLQQAWQLYCRQSGEAIVGNKEPESQKTFAEDILTLQKKLDNVLKSAFFNQDGFKSGLKNAFEFFINLKHNSSASLIAKYVDRKLKGEKGVTEQEVEQALDQIMILFRYLQEKDIFEAFYKKNLSKRLLLGKSANFDAEKNMLSKLKTECGSNYTAKLEGMFQDIELGKECQAAFLAHLNKIQNSSTPVTFPGKLELEMQVLTTGYWPTAPPCTTLILPEEITTRVEAFESFYSNKYQGRRLVWAHALERCVVTARFPNNVKKELEVSFYQALVLRCFNRSDNLTFTDISLQTGIEKEELGRTLQSLACGPIGTRVLVKDPKTKDVEVTDTFWFNKNFTNKMFRIKINSIQLKETAEEVERTNEEVFRDREYQVDAAIVRIMKARKRLPHTSLMSELLVQLRFPAQTSDLKKRIESLIERDYLMRDPQDNSTYNYVA